MNEELIKRIEFALRLSDSEIVSDVLSDCRAALTKKYVPMTEREKHEITTEWMNTKTSESLTTWVENEVIRRAIAQGAKLEVQE